jgi:trans-aconitate 2-methyltransferase
VFVEADLGKPLPLRQPVDAVLSTSTLHWVLDHDGLFANLASVLRPRGALVAQCGGAGNVATMIEVARRVDPSFQRRVRFETAEATAARLAAAGFADIECWLSDEPTRFERGQPFEDFLETVCLRQHLDALPEDERRPFVEAVAAAMPEPVLDYVRLNIVARHGS